MQKSKPIHPFPARMAPEIAFKECGELNRGAIVLDPMCGSGTTLRVASDAGIKAYGSDLDPLAVLISRVNTTYIEPALIMGLSTLIIDRAHTLLLKDAPLPWIDNDEETRTFVDFWFAKKQSSQLRKLVAAIQTYTVKDSAERNFLMVAISRLIITKEMKASLARDTAHSRPHRIALRNDFNVFENFLKSCDELAKRIPQEKRLETEISVGDARDLKHISSSSIDAVITSPPYLNAIDYMRGNKLSLVWMGYRISELREVRSENIGAERSLSASESQKQLPDMLTSMRFISQLSSKRQAMFRRYVNDMILLMNELERVVKPGGKAIFVVGNSCLEGVFIKNTEAVIATAKHAGFIKLKEQKRNLPENQRYMPIFSSSHTSSLAKRMRTESILYFQKPTTFVVSQF